MSTPAPHIFRGMNRRDLDRAFRQLGGCVEILRRTGDVRYSHPLLKHRAKANCRRKDASLALVLYALEAQRAVAAEKGVA